MASDPRTRAALRAGSPVLSRRTLLVAVGATGGALLAGCDLGGSDPSDQTDPIPPPPPTEPLADTELLVRTWQETRRLRGTADTATARPEEREALAETVRVLGIQEAVLARLVRAQRGGTEPLPGEDASGSPAKSADSTSRTAEPREGVEPLAAALATVEDTPTVLGAVSGSNLPTLLSLHGVRYELAERLGSRVQWRQLAGPSGTAAITALAGLRQAVYGFEVLAARSGDQERARYRAALATLRPLTRTLTALTGPAAPAPPLGYGWERPADTLEDRRRAARDLAEALPQAVMAGSSARAGDVDAIAGTLQIMAVVLGVGGDVGVPLSGFPGLTVPQLPH